MKSRHPKINMKVKFLIEKENNPDFLPEVFAFFPNEKYNSFEPNIFTSYAHIGQHSACHIDYANECKEANYNQFQDLLRELISIGYNDLEIENKQQIEAHRKPTASEIKFGHGATHYRTFQLSEILNKKGNIKQWFVADDKLRYYTT